MPGAKWVAMVHDTCASRVGMQHRVNITGTPKPGAFLLVSP